VSATIENFIKARREFAQDLADLSQRNQNCSQILPALKFLISFLDEPNANESKSSPEKGSYLSSSSEKQLAATVLARMARSGLADQMVTAHPNLIQALVKNTNSRPSCLAVAKLAQSSLQITEQMVDAGVLHKLAKCVGEFDVACREAAIGALATMCAHSPKIAWKIVKMGGTMSQGIIQGLLEPELSLKHACSWLIAEIAKHEPDLAHWLVDNGAVQVLCKVLSSHDAKLKKNSLRALACIAQHGVELAEGIIEAEVFPTALLLLKDVDSTVKKAASELAKAICKQSSELAQLMTSIGAIGATIDYLDNCAPDSNAIPAILTLGLISSHSETLATNVIAAKSVQKLASFLDHGRDEKLIVSILWTLGQIGQHSAEHARSIAICDNLFLKFFEFCLSESKSLNLVAKDAFQVVLQKCTYLPSIELLVLSEGFEKASEELIVCALNQFCKVLPLEAKFRKSFVTSGCLKKIQELEFAQTDGTSAKELILSINACFPQEIVRYYSPGYSDALLDRLDGFESPVKVNSETSVSKN